MCRFIGIEFYNESREESVKSMEILSDRDIAEHYLKERDGFVITDDNELIRKYRRAFKYNNVELKERLSNQSYLLSEKIFKGEIKRVEAIYRNDAPLHIEDYGEYYQYEDQITPNFKGFDTEAKPYLNKILEEELYTEPRQFLLGQMLFDLAILLDISNHILSYRKMDLIQISFRHRLNISDWTAEPNILKNDIIKKLFQEIHFQLTEGILHEVWEIKQTENDNIILKIGLYNKHKQWFAGLLADNSNDFYELLASFHFSFKDELTLIQINHEPSSINMLSQKEIKLQLGLKGSTLLDEFTANTFRDTLKTFRELGMDENDEVMKILKNKLGE